MFIPSNPVSGLNMAKQFLTNERKFLIKSFFLGLIILTLGILVLNWMFFLSAIFIVGTYFALPSLLAEFRSLGYANGRFFNKEGDDITNRMPKAFIVQFAIFMVLSFEGFGFADSFVKWLDLERIFSEKIVNIIACTATVSVPWLIMHIYFFIKDLPLISYGAYTGNSVNPSYNKNASSGNVSSSNIQTDDYRYNPSYSNIPGNIYHRDTRN
jgi:hypothetical protein